MFLNTVYFRLAHGDMGHCPLLHSQGIGSKRNIFYFRIIRVCGRIFKKRPLFLPTEGKLWF